MNGPSALSVTLLDAVVETLDQTVADAGLPELPKVVPLTELASIPATGDPNELLKHRFLCRGGAMLIIGQTGFGKSSFIMQAAITWGQGRAMQGIAPVKPLRSWIIQAENDEGDLVEARDGVLQGMAEEQAGTEAQIKAAAATVSVVSVDSVVGPAFSALLDRMLRSAGTDKPDLVFIDPLLAYIGGEVNKQEVASAFLRAGLNPVIHRHNIGLIIIHHTNKPPKEKGRELNGDFAYFGSGSSELANWARAILCIQAVKGSDHVFRLLAGKRGRRLRWQDSNGDFAPSRFIAHSPIPGRICWIEPAPGDIPLEEAERSSSGPKPRNLEALAEKAIAFLESRGKNGMRLKLFEAAVEGSLGIGKSIREKVLALAFETGRIRKKFVKTDERFWVVGLAASVENYAARLVTEYNAPVLPAGESS